MSNSELSAGYRGERHQPDSGHRDDGRAELKAMLDTIAAQLQDADQRHMAALNEMQSRISGMGREADALRTRIPDEFAPAFEQIEAAIGELAYRLADVGEGKSSEGQTAREIAQWQRTPDPQSLRSPAMPAGMAPHSRKPAGPTGPSRFDTFDVIESSGARDTLDPWDQQTADALAGVYHSGGAVFSSKGANRAPAAPNASASSSIDEAWLESRFAEIARGIEYSLAHVKPTSGFSEFGDRLDQFERQFAKLFAGVATHDDLAAVRQIEAHMEEVVGHLEKTQDQLERLNTLETQIANISKTLAEMQAASANKKPEPDFEAIARAAAEHTAQRFVAAQPDQDSAADELRPLIEQLMAESREDGEQTAALLDTMQQAMVRLLDKVDAIELGQQPSGPVFELDQRADPSETIGFGSGAIRDEESTMGGPSGRSNPIETASFEMPTVPPPLFPPYDSGLSQQDMARRTEKLRQDLVADVRRAKSRLAAEGNDLNFGLPPQATTLSGSHPIRPSAGPEKAAFGPSAPSPRLMLIAALVLMALAGLWYTFGSAGGKLVAIAPAAMQDPASAQRPGEQGTRSSGTSDAAKSKAEPPPSTPAGDPEKTLAPPPDVNGPRGDLAPTGEARVENIAANDESAPRRTTTLPMIGVAVDLDDTVNISELQQARRHQAMAVMSGELGSAVGRPGEVTSVPATMVPSQAETEGSAAPASDRATADGTTKAAPLDMPPAAVGPLSLRLAAANGDSSAQFEVGARFAEGKGVTQSFVDAAKWYQRSADQGFAQAQYRLGTLYERGLGLKPDREQAADLYQKAAAQGNVKAMHNLAVLSANQSDRSPDYATAAQWFEEAAKRGLPDSQFNLAVLYENGLGVDRDLKKAFMWVSIAAKAGDADAIRRRDILRGKLTAQEIAEAQRMIDTWRITPTDRNINDAIMAGGQWKKNPKNGING